MSDLKRLRELAMAATPGPYYVRVDDAEECGPHANSGLSLVETGRHEDWPIARLCETNSAEWIAAANPQTVLELLDALEAEQRDARRYRWLRREVEGPHIPLAQVMWKLNNVRDSCDWTNLANGESLDTSVDRATAEQEARDLLDRLEVSDAQSYSSGEIVELANLIAERDALAERVEKLHAALRRLAILDYDTKESRPSASCELCECWWFTGEHEVHANGCLAAPTAPKEAT